MKSADPIDSGQAATRWFVIVGIVVLALGLRVACLVRAPLLGTDSARFLHAAERFERGEHFEAILDHYHPLTAYLISRVNLCQQWLRGVSEDALEQQRRRELSAVFVTIACGVMVVLLLLDLSRRMFPELPAWGVGILAACQPYFVRSAADIMSDTVFLMLFLLAIRETVRATKERRWLPVVCAGGVVGAAYLARPEGLLLFLVLPLLLLWRQPREWKWRRARAAVVVLVATLLIVPYAASISMVAGGASLTLKKELLTAGWITAGWWPGFGVLTQGYVALDPAALFHVFHRWLTTAPEVLGGPALLGMALMSRRQQCSWGVLFFGCMALLMGFVLLRLMEVKGVDYLSRRHTFTLVALSLPFAVRGILALGSALHRLKIGRSATQMGSVLLIILAASLIPKAVKAQRLDQLAQKQAGALILEMVGSGEPVVSTCEKVAYYAAGQHQSINYRLWRTFHRFRRHERAWIVFYQDEINRRCPGLQPWLTTATSETPGVELIATIDEPHEDPPRKLQIYRWHRAPGAPVVPLDHPNHPNRR